METRPTINLTLSSFDKKMEFTGKILLFVMWTLALYVFYKSPATIPIHFNASGQSDNYGNKLTLLILPIVATIIYFGLTQLNRYPQLFNYATKITKDNALKQYTIATKMLRFLKLAILVIFSLIILFTHLTSIGVTKGLGYWFLPLTIGLILIPTVISIIKSFNARASN